MVRSGGLTRHAGRNVSLPPVAGRLGQRDALATASRPDQLSAGARFMYRKVSRWLSTPRRRLFARGALPSPQYGLCVSAPDKAGRWPGLGMNSLLTSNYRLRRP